VATHHSMKSVEAYVLDRLEAEQREALERHLFECTRCFQRLLDLETLRTALRCWGNEAVPPQPRAGEP